jgi:hypothetical protein
VALLAVGTVFVLFTLYAPGTKYEVLDEVRMNHLITKLSGWPLKTTTAVAAMLSGVTLSIVALAILITFAEGSSLRELAVPALVVCSPGVCLAFWGAHRLFSCVRGT